MYQRKTIYDFYGYFIDNFKGTGLKKISIHLFVPILLISACKMKNDATVETNSVAKSTTSRNAFVIDATIDAEYLVDTYANGLYTVRAAELIKQHSQNKEVLEFADKLENLQLQIIENIDELASNKKISLPSNLNQFQISELRKLNESDLTLEKEFIRQMESEHRETKELFEKISKESVDNEITMVAIACLTTIKAQYGEVQSLKKHLEM